VRIVVMVGGARHVVHPPDTRGMALIGVMVLTAMLMALAGALALAMRSDTQIRGAFGAGVTGFYAAEAGLNKGMGEYRNIFLDYNVPNGTDFDLRSVAVGNRNVTYQMAQRLSPAPCEPGCDVPGGCQCQSTTIPSGELFAGLNATQYRYTVNSKATNTLNDVEASVGAEFLVGYIPLFQFVAFYKGDLEISPGPAMNLQGRVHTNGSLYLNADAGPLTISDNPAAGVLTVQVSAGNKIYRGRKRSTNECTGNVWVDMLEDKNPKDNNLDAKELTCNGSTSLREVPSSELALWKGSMINLLGNIAIPEPDIIKPPIAVSNGGSADPGVYWEKADLHLILHVGQNSRLAATVGGVNMPFIPYRLEATTKSGTDVSAQLFAFMSDRVWNQNNSRYPGTMPVFITDVPTLNGCNVTTLCNNNPQGNAYNPAIPTTINAISRAFNAGWGPSGTYDEQMGIDANNFDLDYRRGGFWNWRERKWMLLLNINVRDLILWNSQNGAPFFPTNDTSEGGIVIFATIDGPNSNQPNNNYGVRVFGSNDLPVPPLPPGIGVSADPTGVTVVTDQAMYVLGDFNRGTVNGGIARQPASLIGDSINVLSQRYWQNQAACNTTACRDGQSILGLDNAARDAQTTWINAAFLGGVDTTPVNGGAANYNGGLENYPRFHEDWSGGLALNYQGSFVSLGTPEHVNGLWCGTSGNLAAGCNIYNPPTRNWNFDPAFNNAANLPPLTPRFVYVQQVLFTEDFK